MSSSDDRLVQIDEYRSTSSHNSGSIPDSMIVTPEEAKNGTNGMNGNGVGSDVKKRRLLHDHSSGSCIAIVTPEVKPSDFGRLLKPVVKIFATSSEPNYSMPWQMKKQKRSTSSGFIISGRRIMTNAHAVANQTSIMIRKYGDAKKYLAKVLHVGHECDLAVLTVLQPEFWEDVEAVKFGGIPELQEAVTVVGYPTGGDNISVTTGVVSRVDITTYAHSSTKLLAIQIDAAINSGNSGGPAFKDNLVVGIAFETLIDAENIGYIIPLPIILHFLEDIKRHGRYVGFCDLGVRCQPTENDQLRAYLGMQPHDTGILVNKTEPLGSAAGVLQKLDVITAIDDVNIADDGTIPFRNGERISFRYVFMSKYVGDKCNLKILRGGKSQQVELILGLPEALVPAHLYDTLPSYFIHAGMVFTALTRPYLRHQWGKDWDKKAPIKLCDKATNGQKEHPDEEVVILAQVLAAETNMGYQSLSNLQVLAVNDKPIRNLRELSQKIEGNSEKYLKLDLEFSRTILLHAQTAKKF
eukprot:TRINITY_DN2570_c0_g1_i2.p1 TRINITY_DN2570_c0_g1~~TRINITY_DN2570_c0_g1_i2.p1  ORF type:complete len:524 (+),score=154.43 TRINITY_DN2570_c0_g1_i2:96-1667(+)